MKYLALVLVFLTASCVALKQDLERINIDLQRALAAGSDNEKEMQALATTVTSVTEGIEDRAMDWSEVILLGLGAVTGTGAVAGLGVNSYRNKKRVLRGESTGNTPTPPAS